MHVQGLGAADVVSVSDPVDQLAAGEDPAGVAQQQLEQLELLERQPFGLASDRHLVPLDVHAYTGGFDHVRDELGGWHAIGTGAASRATHSSG